MAWWPEGLQLWLAHVGLVAACAKHVHQSGWPFHPLTAPCTFVAFFACPVQWAVVVQEGLERAMMRDPSKHMYDQYGFLGMALAAEPMKVKSYGKGSEQYQAFIFSRDHDEVQRQLAKEEVQDHVGVVAEHAALCQKRWWGSPGTWEEARHRYAEKKKRRAPHHAECPQPKRPRH